MKTPATAAAFAAVLVAAMSLGAVAASQQATAGPDSVDRMKKLPGGLTYLSAPKEPTNNPSTPQKVELGRLLFFDTRLSRDHSMSCATCHDPNKGFGDSLPTAVGFGGKILARNTPTVLNAAYNEPQFWDGRVSGLEAQAIGPIMAAGEMNTIDEKTLVRRLENVPRYRELFVEVFGNGPTLELVGRAIAAYERTLVTPDSLFDRYAHGEKSSLTAQQKRGLFLFVGKAACTQCHIGPNFTDNQYHVIGIAAGDQPDLGRYEITRNDVDRGAFKTPTLRNIVLTGPYMHDGSVATLREVIDLYDRGGDGNAKSDKMFQLYLTETEKTDLVAFLESLTGATVAAVPNVPKQSVRPTLILPVARASGVGPHAAGAN